MSKVGSEYKHFVPASRPHPEYPGCNKHHLVKSLEELKQALANRGDYLAWDTETSSLSPEEGEIVGFSFAFSGTEGWYVPVNHIGCRYNLGHEGLELFYQRLCQCKKTFVYNMRFDFRFMEYAGFDMSKVKYFDVAVAVFMSDTNKKMPSLKWCFTGDTQIITGRGLKPIQEVKEGSSVVVGGKEFRVSWSRKSEKKICRVKFEDGYEVRCTPDHWFLCRNGLLYEWVRADNLVGRDVVLGKELDLDLLFKLNAESENKDL